MTPEELKKKFTKSLTPEAAQMMDDLVEHPDVSAEPCWVVFHLDDFSVEPQVEEFQSVESVREFLMKCHESAVVLVVYGCRAKLSARHKDGKDLRYLIMPDGRPVPLFRRVSKVRVSETLYMGPADTKLDFRPKQDTDEDEFEFEEEFDEAEAV